MSEPVAQVPKRKPFKKQIYRGVEIDKLLEMEYMEVVSMFKSGQRRRVKHGMHPKYDRLVKKIKTAVKNTPHGEKPKAVKTHLRNAIVMPEIVGGIAEVYSGKYWNPVEIKADMCGQYLAEYSMSYKPVKHGKVGHGATRGSKFVSLR